MNAHLTCERVEELLALASLGSLDNAEATVDVNRHLAGCESCRRTAAAFSTAVAMLPDALPPAQPPARLRNAIMARVYAEAAPGPARRRRSLAARVWSALPRSRAFTVATGLAGAAAIALAVWGGTRPTGAPPPAVRTYHVAGTTAEPQATGSLYYDGAVGRAILVVHGLRAPDTSGTLSHVYEVWLIPAGAAPVPAGFLTLQPDGQTWASVISGDVQSYQTVAATVEPLAGSAQPTGTQVLSGTLG